MKTCTVNPENAPRKNGTTPEAVKTERKTEEHSIEELLLNPDALKDLTNATIFTLRNNGWDITSDRLLIECLNARDDIASKIWLALYEKGDSDGKGPQYTANAAAREWIRENRSNGVSYNETTEDADGNTVERWTQQPAHNNTEAETLHRFALTEAADYITSHTRTHYDRETVRQFLELVSLYDYPPRRAAAAMKISHSANQVIMNAWKEYRNT